MTKDEAYAIVTAIVVSKETITGRSVELLAMINELTQALCDATIAQAVVDEARAMDQYNNGFADGQAYAREAQN